MYSKHLMRKSFEYNFYATSSQLLSLTMIRATISDGKKEMILNETNNLLNIVAYVIKLY